MQLYLEWKTNNMKFNKASYFDDLTLTKTTCCCVSTNLIVSAKAKCSVVWKKEIGLNGKQSLNSEGQCVVFNCQKTFGKTTMQQKNLCQLL